MGGFRAGEDGFELDGRPVRLLSGALHYFRVHEAQWGHRLAMLRAMGLNCVETYVPWNVHEPRPGEFHDVGALGRFLDAAGAAGLWAIVRPGPYICAEWDNGGLPWWLTGELGPRVRTRDARYLAHVERWFARLLPQVVARQHDRGGPVVLVQVENEYGSYGSDRVYLRALTDLVRGLGVTAELCTSDGPEDHMLSGGSVPGVLATVNFGSRAREAFGVLRRHRPAGPLMCMEFWCGWFDHWGAEHVGRAPRDAADALREILECGASVNLYMAHGGTSFAGWAGANRGGALHDGPLEPDVTSYDYDAPIDEYGRPTEKFWLFREVLARYADGPPPGLPPAPAELARPVTGRLGEWASPAAVAACLGTPEAEHALPPAFEDLGVDRGLVRYSVTLPGPRGAYPLSAPGLRDRAVVYVDGVRAGVLTEDSPALPGPVPGGARVELWVESLGRVSYGPRLGEAKGLTGGILHERQYVHGVRAGGVPLGAFDAAHGVPSEGAGDGRAGLYRGVVEVVGAGDAVLELPGWTRGFAWVNGFCVGRYWGVGPQRGLFVPGAVLREGANAVWVLEVEGVAGVAEVRLGALPGGPQARPLP
ncbi:beta-galactosidase family protein [Streptomyces sp. CC224B]|uniref:glycoside hydrolase family 35 protein n=1 Tax=Streptomyces sp. CC224B TaxID=3044571 RepID=UPI0024A8BDE8|nr:beta-galactosidase family protein [Streptomyces sp. CC224B]